MQSNLEKVWPFFPILGERHIGKAKELVVTNIITRVESSRKISVLPKICFVQW